ncbi:MAG: MFS transporter [Pirellulales bacterium]
MSSLPEPLPVSRREVLAWAMYDWANSAYSTLSITILVNYIQRVVFPDPRVGPTVWAWGISASMLAAAVLSPVLGALADAHASKRFWLGATALPGAFCALLLALVPPSMSWTVTALFVLTAFFFELSLGFYNGFLPELADERTMNRVSAWGFGLGYIGGGLALVVAASLFTLGPRWGLSASDQLRGGLVVMGLWWGLFSLPTLLVLRDRAAPRDAQKTLVAAGRQALAEVGRTLANVRAYRTLALFLLAFLFYNDGVQTVITQASTFAIQELEFQQTELIGLILMIQFVAFPGAMLVGWLSDRLGQKPALMLCLAIWIALVTGAWFVQEKWQFWILGAVVALVMGGVQSVSRAIMGAMTPASHSAEFFGFFNLSGKATSFMGTFLFGAVMLKTGNPRQAILSLLVLFLVGGALASLVNVDRGRREAAG